MSDSHRHEEALGVRWPGVPATRRGYGPDPACQPCPDCGGLECLCRPRFFAGQLLTEQDLNRLDHYIVEKHKLHNRHLVGWGVVCGLEVSCDQCGDQVRVSPGYALSPCGEDIVVCKPDLVDVCALIDACRKSDEPDCRPYAGKDGCEGVEEEWVLALRYMERPGRGVTALVGASSCGCGAPSASSCSCGSGGGSCGCGGGGCSNCSTNSGPAPKSDEAPRLRRGAPPSCEPTVVCESYRYEVFRKPVETNRDPGSTDRPTGSIVGSLAGVFENLDGELARRITCCLRDLEKALPKPPGDFDTMTAADRQAWYRWACATKRALGTYYTRIGGTNCQIVEMLGGVVVPAPTLPLDSFKAELTQAMVPMILITFDAILHCICSNLLPPCPGLEDPRVPLAVVTVRRNGCDVVKVCNWTPLRRHVTTFRSLDYWFGWLPLRDTVRGAIEKICCEALGLFDQFEPRPQPEQPGGSTTVDPNQPPPPPPPPAVPVGDAVEGVAMAAPQAVDPLKQPIGLSLRGAKGEGQPVLRRAAVQGLANDKVTLNDIFDLAFRRRTFATGGFADQADEARMAASLAESGPFRLLSGLAHSSGIAAPALRLLGGANGGQGKDDTELAALRTRLDAQEKEIAELRAAIKPAASRRGATKK